MTSVEQQLAAIGFGRRRCEPACWRAVRLDAPVARADAAPDQACSRALLRWRDRLARDPLPAAYRIARVRRS